ncbi:MAG: PAS domain-containing protein, partial [Myxococcota bacterium]
MRPRADGRATEEDLVAPPTAPSMDHAALRPASRMLQPSFEALVRSTRPVVGAALALGVVFSPRPLASIGVAGAIVLARAFLLSALSSGAWRRVEGASAGIILLLGAFVAVSGPKPTAWLAAIIPVFALNLMLRFSRALPMSAGLMVCVTGGLTLSGATFVEVLAAGFVITAIASVAHPLAKALDEQTTALDDSAREIREAHAFQQLVLNTNTTLLFVKDRNYRIIKANQAFLEMYPEEMRASVIGSTTLEAYSERDRAIFLENDKRAFATGYSEVEETIHAPDGSRRVLWTKKVRFEDSEGQPYILATAVDITNLRDAHQELAEVKERLERALEGMNEGLWELRLTTHEGYYSPTYQALLGYPRAGRKVTFETLT